MNMYSILLGVALSAGIAASPVGAVREASAATSTTCSSNNTSIGIDGSFNGSNTFAQGLTVPSGHSVNSIELYVEHQEASGFTVRIMTGTNGPTSVLQTIVKSISASNTSRSEWITVNLTPFVPENQKFWVSFADGQINQVSDDSRISLGGCNYDPYSGGQLHFVSQGNWDSSLDATFADRDGMIRVDTSSVTTTVASGATGSIAPSAGTSTPTGGSKSSTTTNSTKNDKTSSTLSSLPLVASGQTPTAEEDGEQSVTSLLNSNTINGSNFGTTMLWLIALLILAVLGGVVYNRLK